MAEVTKNYTQESMSIEPVQVGGKDFSDVDSDKSEALDQLQAKVAEQRRRSPMLTLEDVMRQPENADLARRSLGRHRA